MKSVSNMFKALITGDLQHCAHSFFLLIRDIDRSLRTAKHWRRRIKRLSYASLCLVLLFTFNLSAAQQQDLRFEKLGFEQGLSDKTVTAIWQDRKGYIWFGTMSGGLNKYDGNSFTKYRLDPNDTNSVSQNMIYSIYEDSEGSIWVSTFEGLCRFDRHTEKFTRYKPSPNAKFSNPNILAINEDADGMLWVGTPPTPSGGVCRFDRRTGRFLPDNFGLKGANSIYKDRAGVLWIAGNGGLHKINLTRKPGQLSDVKIESYRNDPGNLNSLSSDFVNSVFQDRAGIFWVATDMGLNSFDGKTPVFKRYQHDPKKINSISSNNLNTGWIGDGITEDKEGNLWIRADNGLNKLSKDRSIFTHYSNNPADANSISSDEIYSLFIDREGILWVGDLPKLNKAILNPKPFHVIRHDPAANNSLGSDSVTCIFEDASGIIWIGTDGGGLNRWNRKTNEFKRFRHDASNPKSLRSDIVNAVIEDRHGCLWVGNGDVLSKMNRKTGGFEHYVSRNAAHPEEYHLILTIAEDNEGLLWLGLGWGLNSFDEQTGKFTTYNHNIRETNGLSDGTCMYVYCDSRDNIWIGHGSIATDRLDKKTGRFTSYKHDPYNSESISSNIVCKFSEDTNGNIWIGTWGGGLCYFDYQNGKFKRFTEKDGLADNIVFSILEDDQKQLWLGTGNGISRFDPVSKKFTNYDYKDGLQGNYFAAGERNRAAHCKGRDGTLYFGSIDGLVFFDPSKIKANSLVAPIVITQFKLFDSIVKGAHESSKIVLNYDQNYFSFEFAALSFLNPAKNQYKYKLEGVDDDWINSGSRRYAAYTDIGPGTYTFKVMGTNNDGVWNEEGAFMTIVIKPPWWNTLLFKIVAAFVLVASFYALIRWRTQQKFRRQLERSEKEREMAELKQKGTELEMQALRAQMNPHFIFNSLNSINRFILQNNKAQASEYLTKFSKLVRMILQNSQASLITLESELESLELYLNLEALRFDYHFDYKISVPKNLDISALQVPPLILQPYVENAIWHGLMHKEEKGQLDVEVSDEEDYLVFRITDNGIGRKKAAELASKSATKHKSMGLRITAHRIAIVQNSQTLTSPVTVNDLVHPDGSAAGTEVIIKMPVMYD